MKEKLELLFEKYKDINYEIYLTLDFIDEEDGIECNGATLRFCKMPFLGFHGGDDRIYLNYYAGEYDEEDSDRFEENNDELAKIFEEEVNIIREYNKKVKINYAISDGY